MQKRAPAKKGCKKCPPLYEKYSKSYRYGIKGKDFLETPENITKVCFRYHDVLINDDLSAENSFKRVTMIILAPLVTPLMPMILPDASVLQRKRRSARQADYETNFEFQFFDPETTRKMEANQIYEIRKTQFLYKLEYDADWPALEAATAKHFQRG